MLTPKKRIEVLEKEVAALKAQILEQPKESAWTNLRVDQRQSGIRCRASELDSLDES
jgi:hypothetical protein